MNHLAGLTLLHNRYLGLRHGQSEANVAGIVLSDPASGVPSFGLTEQGRAGVRKSVAAANGQLLDGESVILSSDFARAAETAEIAREVLGAGAVELTPKLRERFFGAHERGPNTSYQKTWDADGVDPDHREHGVESANQVAERVTSLIVELEERYERKTILLVSHGDPLQILLTAFFKLSAATQRQRAHWATAEVRELRLR